MTALLSRLPAGDTLTGSEWTRRHRLLTIVAIAHVPLLVGLGLATGEELAHLTAEVAVYGGLVAIGARSTVDRVWRARVMALALLTASVLLIHLTGGVTEAHFHFFVVLPLVALYQMWSPYLLAIGVVAVHHLAMAVVAPQLLFNTEVAQANPIAFALLHAVFVLAACAVLVSFWKLAEDGQTAAAAAEKRVREEQAAAARRAAEESAATAEKTARALAARRRLAAELASSINDVSASGRVVGDEVETIDRAVQELDSAINDISRRTQDASGVATNAVEMTADATATLEALSSATEGIEAVVGLIESLADQTRLLALNATIEAARAGEAGSGFAVVASEVKDLADSTSGAVDSVRDRVAEVARGATSARAAITSIEDVVARLDEVNVSVAGAVAEQSAVTADIVTTLGGASRGVEQIAEQLEQLRAAANGDLDGEQPDEAPGGPTTRRVPVAV